MTEAYARYDTGGAPNRAEFQARPCCQPFSHPNYAPPTGADMRDLVALTGWSQQTLANLVGVSYSAKSGSTTIRKWKADKGDTREIPYAAWRLLLLAAGMVNLADDLAAVGL